MENPKQFIHLYNELDKHFREKLHFSRQESFSQCVKEYDRKYALRDGREFLLLVAELRNVIEHGSSRRLKEVAIPSPDVMNGLIALHERIMNPLKIFPKFKRTIVSIQTTDSLASVLAKVDTNNFSQFPVYDGIVFKGLLTENGITRWLAHHATNDMALLDLDEIYVKSLIREEEKRPNHSFIEQNARLDDATMMFRENVALEVLFISASGRKTEKLLGLITQWDIRNEDKVR